MYRRTVGPGESQRPVTVRTGPTRRSSHNTCPTQRERTVDGSRESESKKGLTPKPIRWTLSGTGRKPCPPSLEVWSCLP